MGVRLMALSKRLRYEILRRDNFTCRYCGAMAPDVTLTVDHVIPTALGGSDEPSNLTAACAACNSGKSATSPEAPIVEDVAADALAWAEALRVAGTAMLVNLEEVKELRAQFLEAWHHWTYDDGQPLPLPASWIVTIDALVQRGLPIEVVLECIPIAMNRDGLPAENRFRYFCGVAWNRVDQLVEDAKRFYDHQATRGRPVPADASTEPYDPWAEG